METLLRLLLVRAGLPEPLLNPEVAVGGGVLHPDLVYPQWGVVLEYEGDQHRTDPRQWRHDIWRREALESAGWRVVRVHRDDVLAEPQAFLARLCRILAQRRRA
jgi:very-short-patch-repair endonuclease